MAFFARLTKRVDPPHAPARVGVGSSRGSLRIFSAVMLAILHPSLSIDLKNLSAVAYESSSYIHV